MSLVVVMAVQLIPSVRSIPSIIFKFQPIRVFVIPCPAQPHSKYLASVSSAIDSGDWRLCLSKLKLSRSTLGSFQGEIRGRGRFAVFGC